MIYCPSCGTANRDGSRFCNECGHKLPSKTGIMCPMCSHMNPAANVYCDRCHARLVPASPSSPAEPPSGIGAAPQAEWVDPAAMKKGLSLPTRSAPAEPPPPEPQLEVEPTSAEEETPDWLLRLRAAVPKPSELAPAEPESELPARPPTTDAGIPSWMRPVESEVPDWFARLSGEQETLAKAEPSAPSPADEEMPDWMREPGSTPSPAPAKSEVPDLSVQVPHAPSAPVEEEVPDWLRDLGIAPPSETMPTMAAPLPIESAQPAEEIDWLDRLRGEVSAPAESKPEIGPGETQPAQADTGLPDWLKQIEAGAETPPPAVEAAAPQPEAAAEEELDWLRALRGGEPGGAPTPAAETPDWLREIQAPPPAEELTTSAATEEPEWLRSMRGLAPSETKPEPASVEEPDWLASLREPAPSESPAETPGAQPEAPEWLKEITEAAVPRATPAGTEIPDWLLELGAEQAAPTSAETAATPPTGTVSAFVGEEVEALGQVETPEWLSAIDQPAPPAEAAPAQPAELPTWLRELGPMPSSKVLAEESPFGELVPAVPGEAPVRLQEMQPGKPATFADESGRPLSALGEQAVSGLEAASIPSWLQALRPRELAAPPEAAEGVTETEGLLLGLSSVLPASTFMGQMHGAPAVTKVQPPAADLARADLFQEILARGSLTPVGVGESRKLGLGDRVVRWLIAAALLLLIWVPNVSPIASLFFRLGAVDQSLFEPAARQVEALSAGDRVLMIFDYDASQAGEMNAIAEAFVRHIGLRGAAVIAGSLNPIGPALANRVVQTVAAGESPAPAFINQGYVPGQAVGVQKVLISNPVQLIVVLAGSPESLRWWIEQVAAARLPTPVVAGLSASALPQAMPYIQSGQVKTAVSGLTAGLAYQRSLDPAKDARPDGLDRVVRSEALVLSQIAFAVILIVGAFVSLFLKPKPSA